jgi:hypothetical protein
VIVAAFFVVALVLLVLLEWLENKKTDGEGVSGSPLTPEDPLLKSIVIGVMHTVCRGVTVPRTPEEAKLRAFIFRKQGEALVCTHFWAPESMIVKEHVGLNFPLERKLADRVAVVRAYFDGEPARTPVEEFSEDEAGVIGEISDEINFVLAVPIFSDESRSNIIGVVDIDSSNEIGQALLASSVSDNVMWHLAEHIRLLFSLTEPRK